MLTTGLLIGQSVGTGVNTGSGLFAAKLNLQATTGAVSLQVQWAVAAGSQRNRSSAPRIYFATSTMTSLTGPQGAAQLLKEAIVTDVAVPVNPGDSLVTSSAIVPVNGPSLWWWVDWPASPDGVADSINLNLFELN